MTIVDKISKHVASMAEFEQIEVLDFIEYLENRARERRMRPEAKEWSSFSLAEASRGLEEEPDNYRASDVKELF